MRMNGHPGPVSPADHTSILIGFALRLGRLEGRVERMEARRDTPPPARDWLTIVVGAGILAAAAAGKITWADALPSLLGFVGR